MSGLEVAGLVLSVAFSAVGFISRTRDLLELMRATSELPEHLRNLTDDLRNLADGLETLDGHIFKDRLGTDADGVKCAFVPFYHLLDTLPQGKVYDQSFGTCSIPRLRNHLAREMKQLRGQVRILLGMDNSTAKLLAIGAAPGIEIVNGTKICATRHYVYEFQPGYEDLSYVWHNTSNATEFTILLSSTPWKHPAMTRHSGYDVVDDTKDRLVGTPAKDTRVEIPRRFPLRGLGGVGKTEMATRFAYAGRDGLGGVFLVDTAARSQMASCFPPVDMKLSHEDPNDVPDLAATKLWISMAPKSRWLVVFHSADAHAVLSDFTPLGISPMLVPGGNGPGDNDSLGKDAYRTVKQRLSYKDVEVNGQCNVQKARSCAAMARGNDEMLLRTQEVDLIDQKMHHNTALHVAASTDHSDVVRLLISGKDVNADECRIVTSPCQSPATSSTASASGMDPGTLSNIAIDLGIGVPTLAFSAYGAMTPHGRRLVSDAFENAVTAFETFRYGLLASNSVAIAVRRIARHLRSVKSRDLFALGSLLLTSHLPVASAHEIDGRIAMHDLQAPTAGPVLGQHTVR